MRYLYACYNPVHPDALLFFGEDRGEKIHKKRGRKPKNITRTLHPYSLSYERLIELLTHYHQIDDLKETDVSLLLPVKGSVPLLPDETGTEEELSFIPIKYPAVAVPVNSLFLLLPSFVKGHEDGIVFTDSIDFYQTACNFSLECIVREMYLPHITPSGPDGRWAAFFGLQEQERLRTLASAMPGICFAFPDRDVSPINIVHTFIDSCVNSVLKSALHTRKIPLTGRAKSGSNPASLWIIQLWGEEKDDSEPILQDPDLIKKGVEWLSEAARDPQSRPFTTCLRLVEPSEASEQFKIEFLLQAHDDPSLVIPAEQIWKKRSSSITYLNKRFDRPQEQMLADLYRARTIFPPLEEALRSRAPVEFILASDQVYPFLHEAAPLLQQCNIPVLLPAWWKDTSKRPVLRLSVSSNRNKKKSAQGSGFFTLETILLYKWEISIGDVTIPAEEFLKLVDLKMPLVHIGGKWVAFSPQDIKKAIATFQKQYPQGMIGAMDALRLGLTGTDGAGLSIEVTGSDTESKSLFTSLLGDEGTRRMGVVKVPDSFKGELRPYQGKGLSWLSFITRLGLGACLADDMGLGKTVQLIAYILAGQKQGMNGPILLICPMSLIGNWQRELVRFAPGLSVYIHHGTGRTLQDGFMGLVKEHNVVLSTYQLVYRDNTLFESVPWDLIVLDEAQNIKNSETLQAKAVRSLTGERKIALTGTPVENRLTELWSIMEFLNPGYLGAEKAFERTYSIPIEKYHDSEASIRLKKLVQPFIMRRVKTDRSIITDLPEKNVMRRYCTLTQEQATLYQAMVESILTEVADAEGIARRAKILTALIRFKQICNHPDAFLDDGNLITARSGKISLLFSLLEDVIAAGDAAILFTQFPTFGQRLVSLIEKTFGEEVLFLHGKTPRTIRDEMVQRFSHPHGPKLFVLSLKAGGVGLNLIRASHVFHIDRWWNPAVEDQATDRAYRIGQQQNVSVHLLISTGTIEERIDAMMEEKRSLAGSIIGTGEDWVTSLSTDELRDLFTLRGELIGGES